MLRQRLWRWHSIETTMDTQCWNVEFDGPPVSSNILKPRMTPSPKGFTNRAESGVLVCGSGVLGEGVIHVCSRITLSHTFSQSWFNAGPTSQTVGQHYNNLTSMGKKYLHRDSFSKHKASVGMILVRRRKRLTKVKPTLAYRLVLACRAAKPMNSHPVTLRRYLGGVPLFWSHITCFVVSDPSFFPTEHTRINIKRNEW